MGGNGRLFCLYPYPKKKTSSHRPPSPPHNTHHVPSFIIVCLIVYFLVVLPLMHLLEALDPKSAARPCPECLSIIPAGARRCKFCTATVPLGASFKKKMKADESGELAADLKEVQDSKV